MPLSVGQVALQNSLNSSWATTSNSYATAGNDFSQANLSFAQTGIPMLTDTGLQAPGQTVSGAVTAAPGTVSATGLGGIDIATPGIGLAAAKATLVSTLTSVFANTGNSYLSAAQGVSNAIFTFLSAAKTLSTVTGLVPPGQAVPPPAGPVGPGVWAGTGTGGIEVVSGPGLSTGLPTLISLITAEFTNTSNTPNGVSSAIANALETFFKTANITTVDTGTCGGGPAAVAPPPAAPNGVTLPPGSPAIGSGTGVIV